MNPQEGKKEEPGQKEESGQEEEQDFVNDAAAGFSYKRPKKGRRNKGKPKANDGVAPPKIPAPMGLGELLAYKLNQELERLALNEGGSKKKVKKGRKGKKKAVAVDVAVEPSAPPEESPVE